MEYHWILLCVSLFFTFHPGKAIWERTPQLVAVLRSDCEQEQFFCMATIIHAAAAAAAPCRLHHTSLFLVELELKVSDEAA